MIDMVNQNQLLFSVLPPEQVTSLLNPNDPNCPFHESHYIGNRAAVDEILDLAYGAFQSRLKNEQGMVVCPRCCPKRVALLGRASTGKTMFAKIFATQVLGLPFCAASPEQVTSAVALFELLKNAYSEFGLEIEVEETKGEVNHYILPAAVLFIDEVHLLSGRCQDALLSMTEANDGTLLIEDGVVDCRNLTFIIATTDKGRLRAAFKTRFRHILLKPHTTDQIAKIIAINYPNWCESDCMAVARYKPIPREAKDFAESVMLCADRHGISVLEGIKIVAEREGCSEGGINANALRTLQLLKNAPDGLSRSSLCAALSVAQEEFENDIVPCLCANDLHPAYLTITNRHNINDNGLEYLKTH